jgi:hypothetical protein
VKRGKCLSVPESTGRRGAGAATARGRSLPSCKARPKGRGRAYSQPSAEPGHGEEIQVWRRSGGALEVLSRLEKIKQSEEPSQTSKERTRVRSNKCNFQKR